MPLSAKAAVAKTNELLQVRRTESSRLDKIHRYLRNEQRLVWLPTALPSEVARIAKIARVNMMRFVVDVPVQAMYVDGYRTKGAADDEKAWETWQRNRFDARQIGVHRAGIAYGASYVTVLPGKPVPVMRGASPRQMTTQYGSDDDWPVFALEEMRPKSAGVFRLYDETHVYTMSVPSGSTDTAEFLRNEQHGAGVVPVVRYRDTEDLDDPVLGAVEPLFELQDQINLTTFGLLVAQHYGAFRQRYIIGWLAESEEERLRAGASRLLTFEDAPEDVQVGEFQQTQLDGYISSREATLRHMATISQTPAHELLGQLVNLSAEALAAAEASHRRAVTETQTVMGEAHEQALGLVTEYSGDEIDPTAYVRWKDTEARSMAQMADALGKMATMLGIPVQELWERIPGVSQDELARWKAAAKEGDAIGNLRKLLDAQATPPEAVPEPTPIPAA